MGTAGYAGLSFFMAHLAAQTASVFFVIMSALSVMFGFFAFVVLTRRLVFPRTLELTEDAILYPHGFPRTRVTRIPYANIILMRDGAVSPNMSFCVVTGAGDFEIMGIRFTDMESYRDAKDFIQARAAAKMASPEEREKISAAFPEPIMEPEDWPRYRRHLVISKPLLPRLGKALWFAIRCLGVFSIPWLLLQALLLPTISFTGFLGVCMPVTFFFTCLYWGYATHPVRVSRITMLGNGISVLSGLQTWNWSYRDFSSWAMIDREFEGRTLYIVLLERRPDYVVSFTLPDGITRERFVGIFRDKKIPESPGLKPAWEER
ncbi:MAG TPA: hypothetical protein VK815_11190 [Candidatus Acidoferrales bacterium]|nr:hypothetical protein [Candidatus Acidoferrales bacterium]